MGYKNLLPSTVGFDRLLSTIDDFDSLFLEGRKAASYPPYNIIITDGITTYSASTIITGDDIVFSGLSAGIWTLVAYDALTGYYTQTYNLSPFPNRTIEVVNGQICVTDQVNSLIILILVITKLKLLKKLMAIKI